MSPSASMHRYVVTLFYDILCSCNFSYHALLSLRHESHAAKTTTVKKLSQEEGISIQEAERQLDADAFLGEYPQ